MINKIDMEAAMVDEVKDQIVDLLGCKHEEILAASGKTGQGVRRFWKRSWNAFQLHRGMKMLRYRP